MDSFSDWLMNEMPLRKVTKVGDWNPDSKSGYNWTRADAKLWNNERAVEKVHQKWSKLPVPVDAYMIRKPGMRNAIEIGEVSPEQLKQLTGEAITPSPDAITVVYSNNRGDSRVPMTAWIMAHRLGHAIRRTKGYERFTVEVERDIRRLMEEVYGVSNRPQSSSYGYGGYDYSRQQEFSRERKVQLVKQKLFQAIGTMRSARNGDLLRVGEIPHELIAQYIIEGRIKLNPPPTRIVTRKAWGRPADGAWMNHATASDPDQMEELAEWMESMSEEWTHYAAYAIRECVGKLFLM